MTLRNIVNTIIWDDYTIFILYLEFPGGGVCYEYEIHKNNAILISSQNEYGQPEIAAADAFYEIANNNIPVG